MIFNKPTTSYGRKPDKDGNASPYDRAKREWDSRLGMARVQAFHWRVIALLSVVGMIALGAALAHVSARKDVRTYVVEVDQLGQPARVTLIGDRYEPDSAQIGYFVGRLVRLVRGRPLDPVVVRENRKQAYAFLAGDAIQTMNAYATSDPPLKSVDGRPLTRVVEITNVLQKTKKAFQVRWLETDYAGGVPQQPEHRTGLFHIETQPPRDETDVFRNPLGIYVVNFSWSKEFTGPVASDVALTTNSANQSRPEATDETSKD
jgi:type IV secretion system protein TrbF